MKLFYLSKLKTAVEPGIKGSDVDKTNDDVALTKEVYETEVITLVLVVEKAVSFIEVKIDEIVVKLDM